MIPEQKALLEKAKRSLQAAKILLEQDFTEFAISRTYYSMFYLAEAFLEGEGLTYSSHAAVIAAFGQQFARPERLPRKFHRYLIDAERSRLRADYNIDFTFTPDDADRLIEQAEEFWQFALSNMDIA